MSTVRSRKSKGKRLQNLVTLKFRDLFKEVLTDGDIQSQIMGVNGVDVVFSPAAKNLIPYDIECKNTQTIVSSVMKKALEQAEENTEKGRIPLLIIKSNNETERVILKLEDFLNILYPKNDIEFNATKKEKILMQIEKIKQIIIDTSE